MAEKTQLYQNEATQFYADSGEKTELYGATRSDEHGLEVGQTITLNESKYTIISIISQDSGEAVIYGIEDEEGKMFALKMYFEFRRPSDEPNPESLRRILQITDPDLLKLHNFGTEEAKFQEKYCYEISDFAKGGDLLSVPNFDEKFDTAFLETQVVPQIFKGIRTLHRNKIFHCDMKPQNVFFRDAERTNLVIGDYGSAKTFDFENGKDARKTSTVKGTDFYLPPEQARGFISEKNDYYSFGMILLHLTYPEKVCQNGNFSRLNRQKLKEIIEKQFENQPIINYESSKGRINELIAGLTLSNVSNRWGEQEVRRWLGGETPEIKYRSSGQFSAEKKIEPIDLGDRMIQTETDLIEFIEGDSEWYEILIEDRTGRDLFNKWLVSIHNLRTKRDIDKLIKENQQYGIDFIQEAILRFFQPYRPITIKNWAYDFAIADDLKFETARYFGRLLSDYYTMSELRLYIFKYKLALKSCPTQNEADKVRQILTECHQKFNPDTKEAFPNTNFSSWTGDAVGRLVGKENAELHIYFEDVTAEGTRCTVSESLTQYFAERGEDLTVEYSEERTFDYPNYPIKKDVYGSLLFSADEMYDLTVEHIRNQLITDKPMNFKGFKRFDEELENRNPIIWRKLLLEQEVLVDFQDLKKVIGKTSNESQGKVYQVDYQITFPKVFIDGQEVMTESLASQKLEPLEFTGLRDKSNWNSFEYQVRYNYTEDVKMSFTEKSIKMVRKFLRKETSFNAIGTGLAFLPFALLDMATLFRVDTSFSGWFFIGYVAIMALATQIVSKKSNMGLFGLLGFGLLMFAMDSIAVLSFANFAFLLIGIYHAYEYFRNDKYELIDDTKQLEN